MANTTRFAPSLTNEQQYRAELTACTALDAKYMTDEERAGFAERARAGDREAAHAIMQHLLPSVERLAGRCYYAYRWASSRIEYLDLVQIGNETLLLVLDRALQTSDNPYPYLIGTIKRVLSRYCASLAPDAKLVSLDAPWGEEQETTLLSFLAESVADPCYSEQETEKSRADYTPIYEATHQLNERERLVITQSFGLEGSECWQLTEIDTHQGWNRANASAIKELALTKLQRLLTPHYPHYALLKGIRNIAGKKGQKSREQRLDEAYDYFQARGEPMTLRVLAHKAGVTNHIAGSYLQARGYTKPPTHTSEDRLERAYTDLLASGEPLTILKLKKTARVSSLAAARFFHEKQGSTVAHPSARSLEKRLDLACETLLARGEKVTIIRVMREAHAGNHEVQRYLKQRRAALRAQWQQQKAMVHEQAS